MDMLRVVTWDDGCGCLSKGSPALQFKAAAARPDLLDSSSNYLQTNTNDDNPHTPDDDD
ncbi:hypothetical protein CGMCC3_g5886 [Colletotrichum fructicola]|nr:uncharacterized protein CGMCC3_g5886 [Colletotrichum fructicola]KAE9578151.1 hypothetical protein CGMCC3_g5886 [Colletotrichum fructicola]